MKKLLILLCVMLVASSSFAIIEPDDNMMGFYFDQDADTPIIYDIPAFSVVTMYLTLVNPTFNYLYGFEAGFDMSGEAMALSVIYTNPHVIDIGEMGNHIVGFGEPTPMQAANILSTYTFLYSDADACDPVEFFMHGTIPSSLDPAYPTVLLEGDELMSMGVSDWYGVTSAFYGDCVVPTTETSLGSIKSLYR